MDARCPRCSNLFTTDRSGIQFCPNCGQQIDVPAPPAAGWGGAPPGDFGAGRFGGEPPPGGGGGAFPGGRELTPWERRREVGAVKGLFETWKRSVFTPHLFFPTVRPDVPWSDALYYGWIFHAISVVLSLPLLGLGMFSMMMPKSFPTDLPPEQMELVTKVMGGAFGVAPVLASLVLYPLGAIIGGAVLHLFAMILGSAKNGWGATMRAFCYASGPSVLAFIPCVGFLVGIYVVVLEIMAIQSLQETSTGKAVAIVLLPLVVFCCCIGLAIFGVVGMAGLAGAAAGGSRTF